tara:strand:- start:42 stop:461 length:420 start_codon:yes stop_codon:yes gene_type:complete
VIKKKNITQEDIDTWKNYVKNPKDITDKDAIRKNNRSNYSRYRYDLHGFTLSEANEKVKELILQCLKNNYKEILLITGKGIHSNTDKNIYVSSELSKLKYSIPEFINSNLDLSKNVSSISPADKKDGGEGAIIIKLKKL